MFDISGRNFINRQGARWLITACFGVAATFYLVYGWRTIWVSGWRELYADQWRLYRYYLGLPFPSNILILENGHRPVLPAIVRVAEIEWMQGDQRLQLALGALLATATGGLIAWGVLTDRRLSMVLRAAGAAIAVAAVFWLGNVRSLVHGNESVHTYLLTTALGVGLILVHSAIERREVDGAGLWGRLGLVGVCAIVCTFSFGTGAAAFVAAAALLVIGRAPRRWFAPLALALVASMTLYFAMPRGGEITRSISVSPFDNARYAAQWLATPAVYLFQPFLEAGASHPLLSIFSTAFTGRFGNIFLLVWPQAILGGAGCLLLCGFSLSIWRLRRLPGRTESLGLGLAWFGLASAAMVGLTRTAYFQANPDQVYAYRYVIWPSLFWLGLGLAAIGGPGRRIARGAAATALLLLSIGLPTELAWANYASIVRLRINQTATGLVLGVLDPNRPPSETLDGEVLEALPLVRERKISMFAWPVVELIGARLPDGAGTEVIHPEKFEVAAVENLLPGPAASVRIELKEPLQRQTPHLLLLDGERRVIGLAAPGDAGNPRVYLGYLRESRRAAEISVEVRRGE